jgi:hypothetical protein
LGAKSKPLSIYEKKILMVEMRKGSRKPFFTIPSRSYDVFKFFIALLKPYPEAKLSEIVATCLEDVRMSDNMEGYTFTIHLLDMEEPICPLGSLPGDN